MIISPVMMEELAVHYRAGQYKLLERKPDLMTVHAGLDHKHSDIWCLIKRWIIKK